MTWAIMDFHSSLSLAFSNSATSWYLTPLSPIHSFKFAIQRDCFLPLLLFPSILPVNARFSKPSFLIKCPRNNLAPRYLSNLLQSRPPSRLLQSSQSDNIYVAYFKNSQCQLSSFSSAGPRAWNTLPTAIKTAQSLDTFQTLLKTHLFNISYNK